MSFYNLFNEEISQESILNDLITYYKSLTDSGKSKITDFNPGSEIRTLLEVMSHLAYNILEEQNNTLRNHFINTADGEYLDLLGSNPNVNLERIQGTTSTGLVKFTLPVPAVSETIIPAETVVSTDSIEYYTLEDAYIPIGETETYVPVECSIDGSDGNCDIGDICNCELSDFNVINEESFTEGSDYEEDDEYRDRLLNYIQTDNFGSRGYYENILLNIAGVHDILENSTDLDATVSYYVNTNDSSNSTSVFNNIMEYFSDNNNIVVGHFVKFIMSDLYDLTFSISVPIDCGYSEEDIKDFFYCYFHGGAMQNYPDSFPGLNMAEETNTDLIMQEIQNTFPDITNIHIYNINKNNGGADDMMDSFEFDEYAGDNRAYNLVNVEVVFR